jgi:hypothetical protein
LTFESCGQPMPRRSITPGRKFSQTTSTCAARRSTTSTACGRDRSSVRLRFPAFAAIQPGPIRRSDHSGETADARMSSPASGSTLITSAPCSASWNVAKGPAR